MGKYDKYYNVQNFYMDLINKELVGPMERNEIIDVFPLQSYVSGILWAQPVNNVENNEIEEEILHGENEEILAADNLLGNDIDEEISTGMVNTSAVRKPSTMGISCILDENEKTVIVRFNYAKYMHSEKERIYGKDKKAIDHLWERKEFLVEAIFDVSKNKNIYKPVGKKTIFKDEVLQGNNDIDIIVNNRTKNGIRLFTFTIVNLSKAPNKDIIQNESALFQCEMTIESEYPFVPIGKTYQDNNIENQILDMQYSEIKSFAQGHGCSANCINGKLIKSSFVPIVSVNQMKSLNYSDKELFRINSIINSNKESVLEKMKIFVDSYTEFAKNQKKISVDERYKMAAEIVVEKIDVCIKRLLNGISVLEKDNNAWRSFVLCNKAMLEQRISMELKKGKIKTREEYDKNSAFWYPFQLFYLVMIIPDIVDGENEFNNKVDLLYFPTGGGKTEAYLAVSAFVIFYERINEPTKNHGVNIIMRYTLRLLTMQQFERATALICACEKLRQEENLGGNEISIGLWIGGESTPNKLEDAKEILEKLCNEEYIALKGNPVQITFCPNCGAKLNAAHYKVDNDGMKISCPTGCFNNKLPVYVVDEDIYANKPTLLLSTVDKFARIVWDERTSMLFGGYNSSAPRLIIQDELHLISGPLGTLTGIYESAIDFLCSRNGTSPKIIASTATLKNSKAQIKNLFNRDVIQFPPSGISYKSSYFADIADKNERPARTYIGVAELGGSMLDLFLRVFSVNTLASYIMRFKEGVELSTLDTYYTLVGYFNALRELGTSSTAIKERMTNYINYLLNSKFIKVVEDIGVPKYKYKVKIGDKTDASEGGIGDRTDTSEGETREKYLYNFIDNEEYTKDMLSAELTSRRTAKEIKEMLDDLNCSINDNYDSAYNYVLSSNMFSVGVDIDRLGSIFVYGQPKSNSEYIQSTSRVGRANPGLVFTAYNGFRSRDKSYYENFYDYHNNFYKYVESTSLTPFSLRSIEKALHSVLIALVRHTVPECSTNESANNFNKNKDYVYDLKAYILSRVKDIEPLAVGFAEEYLDEFVDYWHDCADEGNGKLVYDKLKLGRNQNEYYALLSSADEKEETVFKTLNSVRNVDASANVFVEGTKK